MKGVTVLPRVDCFVQLLDLPRLREGEIDALVRENAQSSFPVDSSTLECDWTSTNRLRRRHVTAVYCRRSVVESLRDDAPTALLSSTEIVSQAAPRSPWGLYIGDGWVDLVILRSGVPASSVGIRWTSLEEVLERVRDLILESSANEPAASMELPVVVVDDSKSSTTIRGEAMKTALSGVSVVSLSRTLRSIGRRCYPLFRSERARRRSRSFARASIPILALAAMIFVLSATHLTALRREAELLDRQLADLQRREQYVQELEEEIDRLSRARRNGQRFGLQFPGIVLAEISSVLPPGTDVQSFSMSGREAVVQGFSNHPFPDPRAVESSAIVDSAELVSIERTTSPDVVRFSLRVVFTEDIGLHR
jgi:hypothetical protein